MEEITATDADSGVNAQLTYRIQKGAFDDFSINETTGLVYVSKKLDYDTRNSYHVEVIAFDAGKKKLLFFFFIIVMFLLRLFLR